MTNIYKYVTLVPVAHTPDTKQHGKWCRLKKWLRNKAHKYLPDDQSIILIMALIALRI